jgi:hypothetical protein
MKKIKIFLTYSTGLFLSLYVSYHFPACGIDPKVNTYVTFIVPLCIIFSLFLLGLLKRFLKLKFEIHTDPTYFTCVGSLLGLICYLFVIPNHLEWETKVLITAMCLAVALMSFIFFETFFPKIKNIIK